ncbi:hypothetical protein LXL04_018101 [Taraxacum kok-saghyz]
MNFNKLLTSSNFQIPFTREPFRQLSRHSHVKFHGRFSPHDFRKARAVRGADPVDDFQLFELDVLAVYCFVKYGKLVSNVADCVLDVGDFLHVGVYESVHFGFFGLAESEEVGDDYPWRSPMPFLVPSVPLKAAHRLHILKGYACKLSLQVDNGQDLTLHLMGEVREMMTMVLEGLGGYDQVVGGPPVVVGLNREEVGRLRVSLKVIPGTFEQLQQGRNARTPKTDNVKRRKKTEQKESLDKIVPSHLTISHLKAYEYSILSFKYFSNLKTTKSSKPPVPKNKLNLVNSLVAAAPHLHVPEGPVEAPTSSNSVVANPATDSAVDNTATDSSSVST